MDILTFADKHPVLIGFLAVVIGITIIGSLEAICDRTDKEETND